MNDSFKTRSTLRVGQKTYEIMRLRALPDYAAVQRLPYAHRILLENLLRHEDGRSVRAQDIQQLLKWDPQRVPDTEIAFTPARVLLQDFTGVPCVVDLAAMRDAIAGMGGDPAKINPLQPVELVIDHSVQVDQFGTPEAFAANAEMEFRRNRERYVFLRWGQRAFKNFKVVPPDTGIVHQVNLEYLARVVFGEGERVPTGPSGNPQAYPDTLVGTDSHTTMINGLGVLGWGVGGIEAEAAMLGQPVSMLIPQVVGVRLVNHLREGSTATDLVLTITEILRKLGVVGKFVEFFGSGLAGLPLADRATIANMSPEFGATCAIFPVDAETIRYLRFTGRTEPQVVLIEAYAREQGLFHTSETPEARYSQVIELDLATVEPSLAGPKRPQDRVRLTDARHSFRTALEASLKGQPIGSPQTPQTMPRWEGEGGNPQAVAVEEAAPSHGRKVRVGGEDCVLQHGSVVIAAITSCTNTSNPTVMLMAGLLAKRAVERGLHTKPWVKTSLAPGSPVVTRYLEEAGLSRYLDELRFHTVGYGCTTCIGNSGPLPAPVSEAIEQGSLMVCSVLSGNRNFEGRIHAEVKANYLMSPPLVVAYALTGTLDIDLTKDPLGIGNDGRPVYLKDLWPTQQEVQQLVESSIKSEMFRKSYSEIFNGDERWRSLEIPEQDRYVWDPKSTYIESPPYFQGMPAMPAQRPSDIRGARVLALLGDSVTTDHISPAGSIKPQSPAGRFLIDHGVPFEEFNSYGARRGNHEVMMRGTFANVRLRNLLVPGTEGGVTVHLPDEAQMPIFDASVKYQAEKVPLLVIAGKEYGSGSSRDWAAKGPALLGVRAVLAESFERIHRSNLIGMGVLPLQFLEGQSANILGLTGREVYEIVGLEAMQSDSLGGIREVKVRTEQPGRPAAEFAAAIRIDTPQEWAYYRHGGILQYVLRQLMSGSPAQP